MTQIPAISLLFFATDFDSSEEHFLYYIIIIITTNQSTKWPMLLVCTLTRNLIFTKRSRQTAGPNKCLGGGGGYLVFLQLLIESQYFVNDPVL